jgi:diguanylate cyclase (GGDEF)-like protein
MEARMPHSASSPTASIPGSREEIARLLQVIEIQNELASTALDPDQIMTVVAARATELCGADAGVVELAEGDEMVYRAVAGTAEGHLGLRLKIDASLSGACVTERRTLMCHDAETDPRVDVEAARAVGALSMLCVPLLDDAGVRGALKVYANRTQAFDDGDAAILSQLSGVIVAHLRRADEFERKAFESRHDVLTDLGNRRSYEERMASEVARATRYGDVLSVVLFDLDHFKVVNDREGHPAGDEVLRRVGAAIRTTRQADDGYRLGGDEFALVVPGTDEAGARLVAERVTAEVAQRNAGVGVTTCWGAAQYLGGDWSDLHATADARLMAAKRLRS